MLLDRVTEYLENRGYLLIDNGLYIKKEYESLEKAWGLIISIYLNRDVLIRLWTGVSETNHQVRYKYFEAMEAIDLFTEVCDRQNERLAQSIPTQHKNNDLL